MEQLCYAFSWSSRKKLRFQIVHRKKATLQKASKAEMLNDSGVETFSYYNLIYFFFFYLFIFLFFLLYFFCFFEKKMVRPSKSYNYQTNISWKCVFCCSLFLDKRHFKPISIYKESKKIRFDLKLIIHFHYDQRIATKITYFGSDSPKYQPPSVLLSFLPR